MGVRGLISFIKTASLTSIADHVDMTAGSMSSATSGDEKAAKMVVDGNAFVHWMCLEVFGNAPAINTDYRLLKERTIEWVMKCHSAGVTPLFVFDGMTETSKLSCRMQRLAKQASHVHAVLSTLPPEQQVDNRDRDSMQPSLQLQSTPPLLAIGCVVGALRGCGSARCRAYYADGEADIAIVQLAVTEQAVAILSNDSDMLIYDTRDVGFIPFWAFGFADTDGSMHAFVIRRRRVAGLLGIVPESLPLLAALAGNDFTDEGVCQQMQRAFLYNHVVKPVVSVGLSTSAADEAATDEGVEDDEGHEPCADSAGHTKRARTASATSVDLDFAGSLSLSAQAPLSTPRGGGSKAKSALDRTKDRRRANRKQEALQREQNHLIAATTAMVSTTASLLSSSGPGVCGGGGGRARQRPHGESALKTVKAAGQFLKTVAEATNAATASLPLTAATVAAALLRLPAHDIDIISRQPIFAAMQQVIAHYDMQELKTDNGAITNGLLRCCFCRHGCGCRGARHFPRDGACDDTAALAWLTPPLRQVGRSATFIGRTPCSLLCAGHDGYSALAFLRREIYAVLLSCRPGRCDSDNVASSGQAAVAAATVTEILRTISSRGDGTAITPPTVTATACDITLQADLAVGLQPQAGWSLDRLCAWITSDGCSRGYVGVFGAADESDPVRRQCALVELAAVLFLRVSGEHGSLAAVLAFVVSAVCALQPTKVAIGSTGGALGCERSDAACPFTLTLEYINRWTLLQQCVQHINDAWEALSARQATPSPPVSSSQPSPAAAPVSNEDTLGIDIGLLDEGTFRSLFFRLLPLADSKRTDADIASGVSTNGGMDRNADWTQQQLAAVLVPCAKGHGDADGAGDGDEQRLLIDRVAAVCKRLRQRWHRGSIVT